MQRMIEIKKTYRIPYGEKTTLLRVLKIGDGRIRIQDLKSGRVFSVSRASFQRGIDEGTIYVSA